jgi:hypothetical protein
VLTDLVAFALPLEAQLKIELLAECDVDRRAHLLLEALAKPLKSPADAPQRRFPPRFSRN